MWGTLKFIRFPDGNITVLAFVMFSKSIGKFTKNYGKMVRISLGELFGERLTCRIYELHQHGDEFDSFLILEFQEVGKKIYKKTRTFRV